MIRSRWTFLAVMALAAGLLGGTALEAQSSTADETNARSKQKADKKQRGQDADVSQESQAGLTAEEMHRELGLSDEQRERIQEIHRGQHEQIRAVMQDESLTREEKQAKIREISRAADSQVREVLNPDQRRAYARWREHNRDHRDEHRDRRRDRMEDRRDRGTDSRERPPARTERKRKP